METNTLKTLLYSGGIGGFVTGALLRALESWEVLSMLFPLTTDAPMHFGNVAGSVAIAGVFGAITGSIVLLLTYMFAAATHLHRYVFRQYWITAMVLTAVTITVVVNGMPSDLLAQMRIAGSVIVGVTTSMWLLRPLLFGDISVTPLRRGGHYAHR